MELVEVESFYESITSAEELDMFEAVGFDKAKQFLESIKHKLKKLRSYDEEFKKNKKLYRLSYIKLSLVYIDADKYIYDFDISYEWIR